MVPPLTHFRQAPIIFTCPASQFVSQLSILLSQRPGLAGQGRTERSRKYSSVRRESRGTSTDVWVKGEGGGRQRDGHRKNRRENSSVNEGTLTRASPADASRDSRPSWGAPSPSPLHPHPSQVPPAAHFGGGCKPAYGPLDRKPGENIGRPSAGGLKNSDGRTMKEQTLLEGGGRIH